MRDDYVTVLTHEFEAEEGSFMLQLRCDFVWDRTAFTRLTEAMFACCQAYDGSNWQANLFGPAHDSASLPRWLAEGFWRLSTFVRDWTTHPAWKMEIVADPDYYAQAYQRLDDLADWFFTGHCSYLDPLKRFTPM